MRPSIAFKRLAAYTRDPVARQLMLEAPVYSVPDHKPDTPWCPAEMIQAYIDEGRLPLPHLAFCIEVVTQGGGTLDLVRPMRLHDLQWQHGVSFVIEPYVLCDGRLSTATPGGVAVYVPEMEYSPLGPERETWTPEEEAFAAGIAGTTVDIIAAIMWRGTRVETKGLSPMRRAMLPRGAKGWEYRVVTLPEKGVCPLLRVDHGGTHASPRWHIRRGHLRHLKGATTWVRECEVGSKDHGGVVKDYKLA